ncbi:hypothetical protein Acsp05_45510 [Actinokineospora sp. NBRC 105648]|nr:hypothetical protein Acsp05_45510 [Actinokineospora sp. NBRC 105648]
MLSAVVVDDIFNEDQLSTLLPENPGIPILITSRTRPQGNFDALELMEFTQSEAEKLIGRMLPAITKADVQALISTLGRRPLALELAARFLKKSWITSVAQFVEKLVENAPETISFIETLAAQKARIVQLYELILEDILLNEIVTAALDSVLSSMGMGAISTVDTAIFVFWQILPQEKNQMRIELAYNKLEEYGLIRRNTSNTSPFANITMHPLTWRIMRDLRSEERRKTDMNFLLALQNEAKYFEVERELGPRNTIRYLQIEALLTYGHIPGWECIVLVDQSMFLALRRSVSVDGVLIDDLHAVSYEVYPSRTFRRDILSGSVNVIQLAEAKELYLLVKLYGVLVEMALSLDIRLVLHEDYRVTFLKALLEQAQASAGREDWLASPIRFAENWLNSDIESRTRDEISYLLARVKNLLPGP